MPYMTYGGWYDVWYLLPAVIIALWAQIKVKSAYSKYSKVYAAGGLTGAAAAEQVLRQNGVSGVSIERVSGEMTDHYDPKSNVIRLSDGVFDSHSVAAVGIAAHEAGHAVQHAVGYTPIRVRNAIIPVCRIGSTASWPLLLIGLALSSGFLVNIGIALFSLSTLFQLVTLPTEFNASRRALQAIQQGGLLTKEEYKGAKSMLSAAAMTYVAALATSILQLLRLIAIFGRRR